MEEFSELLPLMVASGHHQDWAHISERIICVGKLMQQFGKHCGRMLYGCFPNCSAPQNSIGLLGYLW